MTSSPRLSARVADLHASPIREILALVSQPGMISFAGGLPAPETFPEVTLTGVPRDAWQYGASEGDLALREQVAADLAACDLPVPAAQVLILSGSQQGIDLVAKLFVDAGTAVAVEAPTYLAALQVFRFFGARFIEFTAGTCGSLAASRPALAYVNPTFQNPTGYCYSAEERRTLAVHCRQHGIVVFEDDPYRDLSYGDSARRPICADLGDASWIYQGSFSKSLAPGLRLGYLACSVELLPLLTRLKQAADLHSNRLSQALVLAALTDPARQARTAGLIDFYTRRRDAFAALLDEHFGTLADWAVPAGGLFFWLKLRERPALDTRTLLPHALARGIAFMPGEPFFAAERGGRGCLRLNFSHAAPSDAARGLAALAQVVHSAG